MFSDLIVVARRAEVSALAINDLEGNTTSSGGDNRDTGVEGLGNLDLETLTSRELESDMGIIEESVQDCRDVDIIMAFRVSKEVNLRWSLGGILITMMSLEYSSYLVAIKWRTWS